MKKYAVSLLVTSFLILLLINAKVITVEKSSKNNKPTIYLPHKLSDLQMNMSLPKTSVSRGDSNMHVDYCWPFGSSFSVYTDGQYLFAGVGAGIRIYQIDNGNDLNLISEITTPSRVLKLLRSGNHLFVANQSAGLAIYDISNISSPYFVSSVPVTYSANDIDIKGNYIYLADGWYGGNPGSYQYLFQGNFKIIDITDIEYPSVAINWDMGGEVTGVCVKGAYAYVVYITYSSWDGTHTKLAIYDISNPLSPVSQANLELGSPGSYTDDQGDVTVKGTYAFVTSRRNGIKQVDISNIQSPFIYNTIDLFGKDAFRIEQFDTTLLASTKDSGLAIIGIGNPIMPTPPTFLPLGGTIYDASYNNGLYFAACANSGISVICDSNYQILTSITYGNEIGDLITFQGKIIASDGDLGIKIFDTNNPSGISLIGTWSNNKRVGAFARGGDYLFVSQMNDSIQVLDISIPSNPYKIYAIPIRSNNVSDLVFENNKLYVLQVDSGFSILNLVNPLNPSLLGSFNFPGSKWRMKIQGNYGYLAADASGLYILNILNPLGIFIEGFYDPTGNVYDIVVKGNKAYLAAGAQGLVIVDITDPSGPTFISSESTLSSAIGIAQKDSLICLTTSFDRLTVYVEETSGLLTIEGYFVPSGLRSEIFWGSDFTRPCIDEVNSIFLGCGVLGFVKLTTAVPSSPFVFTEQASNISETSVTLNGLVNPNSLLTIITFEYGKTQSYGNNVNATQSPLFGNLSTNVNKTISGLLPNQIYHYRVVAVNSAGTTFGNDVEFQTTVGIEDYTTCQSPIMFQNLPNPFNNTTIIQFMIPEKQNVEIDLYDLYGHHIRSLVNKILLPCMHEIELQRAGLQDGIYFYQLKTGNLIQSKKMIITK